MKNERTLFDDYRLYKSEMQRDALPYYQDSIKALDVWRAMQAHKSHQAWLAEIDNIGGAFYTDCDKLAHRFSTHDGLEVRFTAALHDYPHWDDLGAQGYTIETGLDRFSRLPEFAEFGEATRPNKANGFDFCFPYRVDRYGYHAKGYCPPAFIEQFTTKGRAKGDAYRLAYASAIKAIKADLQSYLCEEKYVIGVVVTDRQGEELASDYCGGFDWDYMKNGQAWRENFSLESLLSEARQVKADNDKNKAESRAKDALWQALPESARQSFTNLALGN